ncbi:MAG: Rpn family recombination-promoting nuclease/putative transposase [Lachnospiraceae bacterium]|nr:Rpn family recombination-promoting nuclease/putative transposase [Lachnospiraceae bacterium]
MANQILKKYFPMIRTEQEVLKEIAQKPALDMLYKSWDHEQKKEFLDFCTGMKGCKLLYDPFFKRVLNPELHPEWLEKFLSLLLKKNVKILQVLPNESRMAAEDTLLAMDIVVELEDGSIANVEMQKIGYSFPGQRSSCYSADLLLRQYQRVKTDRKSRQLKFTYRDIRDVYTIILFENSPAECKAIPDKYIHYGKTAFDTGLAVHMPQEYVYVPLDIFREILHNRGIKSELDAWLTFLCEDSPEMIELLIRQYPYFRELYNEVYKLCGNMEDIMGCFSEALQEMDRNTVQYMIEEQQEQIEEQKSQIEEQHEQIEEQKVQLEEMRIAAAKEAKEKTAAIERILRLGKLSVEEIADCQSVSVQIVREIEAAMLQEA